MTGATRSYFLRRSLIGMAVFLFPSITIAQDSLAWRFKEGEKLTYQRIQDRKHVLKSEDRAEATQTDLRVTDLAVLVDKVHRDGSADLTLTVSRIQRKQETPRGKVEYDSADEKKPEGEAARMARSMQLMLGLQFTCRMTSHGEVRDAKLSPDSEKRFKDNPQALAVLGNKESLRYLVPGTILPEEKVKAGTTWKETGEFTDPIMGTRKLTTTYTWKALRKEGDRQFDEIDLAVVWTFVPRKDSPLPAEVKEQKTTGTIRFDRTRGVLQSREDKEHLKMVMTQQGEKIAAQTDSIVSWKLLPLKPRD